MAESCCTNACPGLCLHPPGECPRPSAASRPPPSPSGLLPMTIFYGGQITCVAEVTEEQATAILRTARREAAHGRGLGSEGEGLSVRGSLRRFLEKRSSRRKTGPYGGGFTTQQRPVELKLNPVVVYSFM